MELKKYLKERGIKKEVLAKYLGVTPNYIHMVLTDRRRLGANAAIKTVGFTGGAVTLQELLSKKPEY